MAKSRQLVLMKGSGTPGKSGGPLGSPQQVREAFASFNTAPDGGPSPSSGLELLHGPGMTVELAASGEKSEIQQVMITVTDDDIAWPVLSRACRMNQWTLVDLESGQAFL